MMFVIGLGNPGERYIGTRHNVGWQVLEALASRQFPNFKFQFSNKFQAEILKTPKTLLVKPMTFMNRSGEAVRKVVDYFQEPHLSGGQAGARRQETGYKNVYVVHDDLDIELGGYKIQFGKGPRDHNGVDSVEAQLGIEAFLRVRVGIDNRQGDRSMPGKAYVLQRFTDEERDVVDGVVGEVVGDLVSELKKIE